MYQFIQGLFNIIIQFIFSRFFVILIQLHKAHKTYIIHNIEQVIGYIEHSLENLYVQYCWPDQLTESECFSTHP